MKKRLVEVKKESENISKKMNFCNYMKQEEKIEDKRAKLKEQNGCLETLDRQKAQLNSKSRSLIFHLQAMSKCMTTFHSMNNRVASEIDTSVQNSTDSTTQQSMGDFAKNLKTLIGRVTLYKNMYSDEIDREIRIHKGYPKPLANKGVRFARPKSETMESGLNQTHSDSDSYI